MGYDVKVLDYEDIWIRKSDEEKAFNALKEHTVIPKEEENLLSYLASLGFYWGEATTRTTDEEVFFLDEVVSFDTWTYIETLLEILSPYLVTSNQLEHFIAFQDENNKYWRYVITKDGIEKQIGKMVWEKGE